MHDKEAKWKENQTNEKKVAAYWGRMSFQIWVNFAKVGQIRNWEQASFSPDSVQYGSCMTLKREKQEIIDKHLCREITHMRIQCICKSIFFPSKSI